MVVRAIDNRLVQVQFLSGQPERKAMEYEKEYAAYRLNALLSGYNLAEADFYAKQQVDKLKNKETKEMYIIGSITTAGGISFSKSPVIHTSEHSASMEASRLAKANPGTEYVYWKAISGTVVGGVTTRRF